MRSPVSRGAIFWGSALVTAGVLILAVQQGLVDEALLTDVGQWWPLLLIGAGVAIIFAGALGAIAVALSGVLLGLLVGGLLSGAASLPVGCGSENAGNLSPIGSGDLVGEEVQVDIDLNCVDLALAGEGGSGWSVEADQAAADGLEISSSDDELQVQSDEDISSAVGDRGGMAVTIPGGTAAGVSIGLNAASADLDFSDGRWGAIDLEGNAVSMDVDLSGAGAEGVEITMNAGATRVQVNDETLLGSSLRFEANAGSIEVCAPDALGLTISMGDNITVGHNLEEAGLVEEGNVWRTPDFDDAETQLDIEFSGNAASFNLNPEDGCS